MYPVIILDEFQDTNPDEWLLIRTLGAHSTLIALADPDQRIYDFRGADPQRIPSFIEEYKPAVFDFGTENNRSNGTDIVDQIFLIHPDPVIAETQSVGFLVGNDPDFPVLGIFAVTDGFKAGFIHGISGICHQFPDKDIFIGIDGMDHQLKKLLNLCLKLDAVFCHDLFSCAEVIWRRIYF